MKKLTVVIVSYNVKFYLEQCLKSVQKALDGIDGEIVVVDNHSSDGSVGYVAERFPSVRIIDSNHNLGFARANNIAIRQTKSEYVLLLNPDTFVGEEVLRDAVDFMDGHPNAGGAGVQMINADGTKAMESRRGLPTPMTALYKMCGLCTRYPMSRRFGRYYMGYLSWDSPQRIEVMSGAFTLLRRAALEKVGLLDEDFFMYGEDIDLSARLLKGGFENWYLPLQILHYKGESTHKTSFRYVHVFYQAMLIFFRKHYRHLGVFISLPIKLAVYGRALMALIEIQSLRLRRFIGISDHKANDVYVFVGDAEMHRQCRLLAERKGLSAEFVTRLSDFEINDNQMTFYVFDTSLMTYSQILRQYTGHSDKKGRIGIFYRDSQTIITPIDIIQ